MPVMMWLLVMMDMKSTYRGELLLREFPSSCACDDVVSCNDGHVKYLPRCIASVGVVRPRGFSIPNLISRALCIDRM